MLLLLNSWGSAIRELTVFGLPWLEFVGLVTTVQLLVYLVPEYLITIYKIWIAPALGYNADLKKMGQWAIVTGASDGIGKAYAEELGKIGLNVVLISRSKDKLDRVADGIEKSFGVKTKVVVVDFTEGISVYKKIEEEIQDLEIGTLINNVGMWYPFPKYFMELPDGDQYVQDMVLTNVFPVTMLSRMVIPQMAARRKGVIVNVGSCSGVFVGPLISVYVATKSYVDRLSQSLALEYEDQGIIIQSLLPGFVATKMSRISVPSFVAPSPAEYVRSAIKTIGVESRSSGYLFHRLCIRSFETLSYYYPDLFARFTMQIFSALREKERTGSVKID
ncbi:unnamed protein product [Allacma fusca]|uniref:Uncharacterized protein n=1 Tax=Allacma fusca TaxID=39272 RepID=A0A8J2JWU9_9HEXA|nr:unnamed protein product [Allacma fusca]